MTQLFFGCFSLGVYVHHSLEYTSNYYLCFLFVDPMLKSVYQRLVSICHYRNDIAIKKQRSQCTSDMYFVNGLICELYCFKRLSEWVHACTVTICYAQCVFFKLYQRKKSVSSFRFVSSRLVLTMCTTFINSHKRDFSVDVRFSFSNNPRLTRTHTRCKNVQEPPPLDTSLLSAIKFIFYNWEINGHFISKLWPSTKDLANYILLIWWICQELHSAHAPRTNNQRHLSNVRLHYLNAKWFFHFFSQLWLHREKKYFTVTASSEDYL